MPPSATEYLRVLRTITSWQGLLDQYELVGNRVALAIALRLAGYVHRRVQNVLTTRSLEHHWKSLNKEFGGMNDVLWKLYALGRKLEAARDGAARAAAPTGAAVDVTVVTDAAGAATDAAAAAAEEAAAWAEARDTWQRAHLRSTASLFDRPCLLGPLGARVDGLSHAHANTQLPVLAGAHTRFEATGDGRFRRLTAFFVELLLRTRTLASGGSSIGEYWGAANVLGEQVAPGAGTTQESCSTHNMMRLSRGLLLTATEEHEAASHAAYHERSLFNSVLGTQRGERPGEMLYWLPLGAGVSKMDLLHPTHDDGQQHGWSHPHGDFWCCVGSGLEAFARLGDSTFFRLARGRRREAEAGRVSEADGSTGAPNTAPPTLYVMQLVASRVHWREAHANVTLLVDEPGSLSAFEPLRLTLTVTPLGPTSMVHVALRVRLPAWAWGRGGTEPPSVRLGAHPVPSSSVRGSFLHLERTWRINEALTMALPMGLRSEALNDTRPRYRMLHALFAGPILLAGLTFGPRALLADPSDLEQWLRPVPQHAEAQLRSLQVRDEIRLTH